jgi:hypothetical protein
MNEIWKKLTGYIRSDQVSYFNSMVSNLKIIRVFFIQFLCYRIFLLVQPDILMDLVSLSFHQRNLIDTTSLQV